MIEKIKKKLLEEYSQESWVDFVNSQRVGNCREIATLIKLHFPMVDHWFGEIQLDRPMKDKHGRDYLV